MASLAGLLLRRSGLASTIQRRSVSTLLHNSSNSNCQSASRNGSAPRLSSHRNFSASSDSVRVIFKSAGGTSITVNGKLGQNILDVAHANGVDLEGACEASLACSTCHVVLSPDFYSKLAEPSDEENDMLDLAFGLTETSRLGCQIILTKELDGIECLLPEATRNMYVDGHKPQPH